MGCGSSSARFLDFAPNGGAQLVDNYDWFDGYGYLDFLRDIGKHFSVNMMMAKESVRARLEDRDQGISYTEFSYMLIQAYDFLCCTTNSAVGCRRAVAISGATSPRGSTWCGGCAARRSTGLTMPLVINAEGQKFGKSEKGNVWLDAAKTPPYDFYQFFFRASTTATLVASCVTSRSSTSRRSWSSRDRCARRRKSARRSGPWRAK